MTDRSRDLVPDSWSLVKERALTTEDNLANLTNGGQIYIKNILKNPLVFWVKTRL